MRISKDDGGGKESESIENQRKLLYGFCREKGFSISAEYTDDGYSGTSIELRPSLLRLLQDIKMKRINTVITKDLSRLGRNTADTSNLIDRFFPENRVRFISVTEGIDTYEKNDSFNFIAPVHNFTNELYSADISNKIRSALTAKMKAGEFIGAFAPYGYKKDHINRNKLVPDGETAETVKRIFALAKAGYSPSHIAELLNLEGIPTPSRHRFMSNSSVGGITLSDNWCGSGIIKILRNEVYLGHSVQGKTKKPGFKSTRSLNVKAEERIRAENTHEPLTDEETVKRIKKLMSARKGRKTGAFQNSFSGIIFCADCGRAMSLSGKNKNGYKLNCCGYKSKGKALCTNHSIEYQRIYESASEIIKKLPGSSSENAIQDSLYRAKAKKLSIIKEKLIHLYDGKYSGEISNEYFNTLLKKYKEEESLLLEEIKKAPKTSASYSEPIPSEPDKIMFARFIKRIEVYENGRFEIYLI